MPLSFPPQLTGDNTRDIEALQAYLYDLIDQFDNAAGSAIDPTEGQGGDGALTITEPPTAITYGPGYSYSRDGMLFGDITITFTKPTRAVGVLVSFKSHTALDYQTVYAPSSPFSLQGLPAGELYDLFLQGQAANSSLGPASPVETVRIDFPSIAVKDGFPQLGWEPDDLETPMIIPGPLGPRGLAGTPGQPGIDAEEPEIPLIIPGPQGVIGLTGLAGIPGLDGEDGSSADSCCIGQQITLPYNTDYHEGSFTITGTGFTANPTGTADWFKNGKVVTLFIPILTGTSNATTFTLTGIPAAIAPIHGTNIVAIADNSGARAQGAVFSFSAGATTFNLYTTAASGAWTNSGTKTLYYSVITYT